MAQDTTQLPVQVNFQMPWRYREHLRSVAKLSGDSFSVLIRDALMKRYPEPDYKRDARKETIDAGATR